MEDVGGRVRCGRGDVWKVWDAVDKDALAMNLRNMHGPPTSMHGNVHGPPKWEHAWATYQHAWKCAWATEMGMNMHGLPTWGRLDTRCHNSSHDATKSGMSRDIARSQAPPPPPLPFTPPPLIEGVESLALHTTQARGARLAAVQDDRTPTASQQAGPTCYKCGCKCEYIEQEEQMKRSSRRAEGHRKSVTKQDPGCSIEFKPLVQAYLPPQFLTWAQRAEDDNTDEGRRARRLLRAEVRRAAAAAAAGGGSEASKAPPSRTCEPHRNT